MPVNSVGVQGDFAQLRAGAGDRCLGPRPRYRLVNSVRGVNRVIAPVKTKAPLAAMQVSRLLRLHAARLARLRPADAIVRRLCHESGYDRQIWQFPVILIPLGTVGGAGLGRAAARGFGGRHDRAIGPHAGRPAPAMCHGDIGGCTASPGFSTI